MPSDQPEPQPPEQAQPQPPGPAAPKGNRGSFRKGGDPRQAHIIREAKAMLEAEKPAPAPEPPLPELVPVEGEGMLGAMRHVLVNPKGHDTTPHHKLARDLYEEDRRGFAKQFGDLEKAEVLAGVKAGVAGGEDRPAAAVADEGSERAGALIERLLGLAAAEAEERADL